MIVTCPSCSTRYALSDQAVGSGRTVRCKQCRHQWHVEPELNETVSQERVLEPVSPFVSPFLAQAPPGPGRDLPDALADTPERPDVPDFLVRPVVSGPALPTGSSAVSSHAFLRFGWPVAALLMIVLLAELYLGQNRIVAVWNPLAQAYEAIGMRAEPAGAGLQLRGVNTAVADRNGTPILLIAGNIANVSPGTRALPNMAAVLLGKNGQILRRWTFSVHRDRLLAGETMPFQTATAEPPPSVQKLELSFADTVPPTK